MKYGKLLLLILGICLLAEIPNIFFAYYLKIELSAIILFSSIVIGLSILLGLLVYFNNATMYDKKIILVFADKFLHKYWKGRFAIMILILLYSTAFVLLGIFVVFYLEKHTLSPVLVAAFSGAIVGSLFSSLVQLTTKTVENWETMTPKLFLQRFIVFFLISSITYTFTPIAILYF